MIYHMQIYISYVYHSMHIYDYIKKIQFYHDQSSFFGDFFSLTTKEITKGEIVGYSSTVIQYYS